MTATSVDHRQWLDRFDQRLLSTLGSLDLKARYLVEGFLNGLHRSPFHGLSVEFAEYQDYHPGDDLRHLDWRLYARTDRLYIKKYTQETNVRVYLMIDTSASMAYRGERAWGSKLDAARLLGAALTMLMINQNDAVGLLTMREDDSGATFVQPSQKPSQLGQMLHHLDELQPGGGPRLPALLANANQLIHRRSLLIVITDLLEPADTLQEVLQRFRFEGHDCLVVQVLDRDEVDFPFQNPAVFQDLESGMRRQVQTQSARDSYLRRFQAFMDDHKKMLSGLEIPHSVMVTDEDPCAAMSALIVRRAEML